MSLARYQAHPKHWNTYFWESDVLKLISQLTLLTRMDKRNLRKEKRQNHMLYTGKNKRKNLIAKRTDFNEYYLKFA